MDLIDTQALKQKLDREVGFKLVITLGEWGYRTEHIPGSLRISTVEETLLALHSKNDLRRPLAPSARFTHSTPACVTDRRTPIC